ncbi:MAG: hypothetical protein ACC742_01560 [Thermoanaerobaculales bacterium]
MRDEGFGGWLVKEGLLRPEGLRQALDTQQTIQTQLDTILLDLKLLPEQTLLNALGSFHKTRTVSGAELSAISPAVARLVSPRIASRLQIVPFKLEGKTLSVAGLDPGDLLVEDELALMTGCMVGSYVTLEARLMEALHRLYGVQLTPQFVSLVKRLSGLRRPAPAETKALTDSPKAARSASRIETPRPAARAGRRPRRPPPIEEQLEVSTEELELFPSLRNSVGDMHPGAHSVAVMPDPRVATADLGPEERLAEAAVGLQNAEMREDIADAVLGFCAPLFRRRLLLAMRRDRVMGWRGEGDGIDPSKVRAIDIPLAEPSVFVGLTHGAEFWLGPLPTMPRNLEIVLALGGTAPTECFLLPMTVREKTVCFLYGDNVDDGVGGLPMRDLRRLGAKASLAFQVYLMKSKIRNL